MLNYDRVSLWGWGRLSAPPLPPQELRFIDQKRHMRRPWPGQQGGVQREQRGGGGRWETLSPVPARGGGTNSHTVGGSPQVPGGESSPTPHLWPLSFYLYPSTRRLQLPEVVPGRWTHGLGPPDQRPYLCPSLLSWGLEQVCSRQLLPAASVLGQQGHLERSPAQPLTCLAMPFDSFNVLPDHRPQRPGPKPFWKTLPSCLLLHKQN